MNKVMSRVTIDIPASQLPKLLRLLTLCEKRKFVLRPAPPRPPGERFFLSRRKRRCSRRPAAPRAHRSTTLTRPSRSCRRSWRAGNPPPPKVGKAAARSHAATLQTPSISASCAASTATPSPPAQAAKAPHCPSDTPPARTSAPPALASTAQPRAPATWAAWTSNVCRRSLATCESILILAGLLLAWTYVEVILADRRPHHRPP